MHAGGSDTALRGGELAFGEAAGGPGPGWRSLSSELRNQHVDKPAYATAFQSHPSRFLVSFAI